jgi:hypothetical protein
MPGVSYPHKVFPPNSSMNPFPILQVALPLVPLVRSIGEHKWESAKEYLERNPTLLEIEADSHRQWNQTFTTIQREIRYILARTPSGYERKVVHHI